VAEEPPLRHEEVRRILRLADPLTEERRIVLIGGQAVAFWMRFLAPGSSEFELRDAIMHV
jgi:hypothetical protein